MAPGAAASGHEGFSMGRGSESTRNVRPPAPWTACKRCATSRTSGQAATILYNAPRGVLDFLRSCTVHPGAARSCHAHAAHPQAGGVRPVARPGQASVKQAVGRTRWVGAGRHLVREGGHPADCRLILQRLAGRHRTPEEGPRRIMGFGIPRSLRKLHGFLLGEADRAVAILTRRAKCGGALKRPARLGAAPSQARSSNLIAVSTCCC